MATDERAVPETGGEPIRLYCFKCGKSVSTPVPADTLVRAALECPECIEAGMKADQPKPVATLARVHKAVARHHAKWNQPDAEYNDLNVAVTEFLEDYTAAPPDSDPAGLAVFRAGIRAEYIARLRGGTYFGPAKVEEAWAWFTSAHDTKRPTPIPRPPDSVLREAWEDCPTCGLKVTELVNPGAYTERLQGALEEIRDSQRASTNSLRLIARTALGENET